MQKGTSLALVLIGSEIVARDRVSLGGTGALVGLYYWWSQGLNYDIEWEAGSPFSLQSHINSLVAVTLQNRYSLDLLTTEKGGTRILAEKYCYYIAGVVATKVGELKDSIQWKEELREGWNWVSA